jgi:hypothetical protein
LVNELCVVAVRVFAVAGWVIRENHIHRINVGVPANQAFATGGPPGGLSFANTRIRHLSQASNRNIR